MVGYRWELNSLDAQVGLWWSGGFPLTMCSTILLEEEFHIHGYTVTFECLSLLFLRIKKKDKSQCPVWGSNSRPSDFYFRLWDWRAAYCANEALAEISYILFVTYEYYINVLNYCCIVESPFQTGALFWHTISQKLRCLTIKLVQENFVFHSQNF